MSLPRRRFAARHAFSALALAAASMASQAAPITRSFEFSSTSGPLIFGPNIGTFTYDSSVAPVGGGFVFATALFSDISLAFGSFTYDETTANSGWLKFDAAGELLDAHFGSNCGAGSCGVSSGTNSWWVRVGPDSVNDFNYSLVGATSIYGTNQNRLLPLNGVPEPAPAALVLAAAMAALALRRKA